ncbi:MAG TPA: hypothetical protein VMV46_15625 [Thermoanaerobaculia bacterium]|nr:hypothetical protein [Thermoanaerobaculia bacterium]
MSVRRDVVFLFDGGLLGALLGAPYLRWSRRSACRVQAFAELVPTARLAVGREDGDDPATRGRLAEEEDCR